MIFTTILLHFAAEILPQLVECFDIKYLTQLTAVFTQDQF